jgi:hypothetical protein
VQWTSCRPVILIVEPRTLFFKANVLPRCSTAPCHDVLFAFDIKTLIRMGMTGKPDRGFRGPLEVRKEGLLHASVGPRDATIGERRMMSAHHHMQHGRVGIQTSERIGKPLPLLA